MADPIDPKTEEILEQTSAEEMDSVEAGGVDSRVGSVWKIEPKQPEPVKDVSADLYSKVTDMMRKPEPQYPGTPASDQASLTEQQKRDAAQKRSGYSYAPNAEKVKKVF